MFRVLLISAALVGAVIVLTPRSVIAEEETPQCVQGQDGVIRCGPIRVFGEVPRPSAYYVVERSRLTPDRQGQDESFTQQIVESVDQAPF